MAQRRRSHEMRRDPAMQRGRMARVTGLEPATSGVTGRRSNQLSYTRVDVGRELGERPNSVKQARRLLWRGRYWSASS